MLTPTTPRPAPSALLVAPKQVPTEPLRLRGRRQPRHRPPYGYSFCLTLKPRADATCP